jgi:hypothetical protein
MTQLTQPPLPAVENYPTASPYDSQVEEAHRRFLDELNSPVEEWQDMGEKDGVRLSKKYENSVHSFPLFHASSFHYLTVFPLVRSPTLCLSLEGRRWSKE